MSVESSAEDRRQHLEMIQAAVLRMSNASSTSKGWLLPVATAAYGYAVVQWSPGVAALGLLAVIIFATLDAHYLRLERAFRALFRRAADGLTAEFDMSPGPYFTAPAGNQADLRDESCGWGKVVWSWSIAGFYGAFAIAGVAIVVGGLLAREIDLIHLLTHSLPCRFN